MHKELERQGFSEDRIEIHPFLNMRYEKGSGDPLDPITDQLSFRYNGTDSALMIEQPEAGVDWADVFAKTYKVSETTAEFRFGVSILILHQFSE